MLSGGDFGKRTVRAVPYVGIQASMNNTGIKAVQFLGNMDKGQSETVGSLKMAATSLPSLHELPE